MGQKDIVEKKLEDYNDVFADIINVLLFDGERRVSENDLEVATPKSQYKAETEILHEQERDVSKYWKRGKVKIALYGLENQTAIDTDMAFRMIGYDGASYRSQLLEQKNERFPVISIVLYFGKKRWDKNKSIGEILNIPEGLEEYFNDYKVNVFEIAWLTDEQINMFKSDFRDVAAFFVNDRKGEQIAPEPRSVRHFDEMMKLMAVITGDHRFEEVAGELKQKGDVTMCDVLDRIEEKGVEKGIEKGIEKGKITILFDMVKDEVITSEDAAKRLGLTEEEFLKRAEELSKE